MRILMLNYEFPPLGGGAANATKYILREFSNVKKYPDLQIDLVTSSVDNFKIEDFSSNIKIYYLNINKKNSIHDQSNLNLLSYSKKAYFFSRKLIKKNNYDLCHAFFGIPCGFIARTFKMPYIISLRGSDVPFYSEKYKLLDTVFFKHLSKNIWKNANAVIANSQGLKKLALKSFPKQKIDIIPNGVDAKAFVCKKKYKKTVEDIKKSGLRIVAGTRIIQRKGFRFLIDAVNNLDDVYLTLIGEGSQTKELKKIANLKKVKFIGYVSHDNIGKIIRENDLCILPSENEGMSNFVLESLASGLPLVLTNVGGTNEILQDNGFLIKKRDVSDIIKKINIFKKKPELLESMGKKSREITTQFDWENIANAYFKEYDKCPKIKVKLMKKIK